MRFNEESISLAHICAADATYRITTAESSDDLKKSIAVLGLIHSPILHPTAAGYRIIAGFRRIEALRALGRVSLKARFLPDGSDESTRVNLAIADNSLQRALNPIESSRALNLLSSVAVDERHLIQMAAALSLPNNPTLMTKLMTLTSMPAAVQHGVLSGELPLSMALELKKFDAMTAETLARIFTDLRLGLNRQRELLTLLHEIAMREDRSIDALLGDSEVRGIVENANLDNARKSGQLRVLLFRWRYPAISERETRFKDLLKALHLGSGVKLIPPGNFEGTTYTLSITFDRIAQLMERGRSLEALDRSDALRKFLEE
jgi:ParB family chromosome partitioning protein